MKKETMKKMGAGYYVYKGKSITKYSYSIFNVYWWVVDGKKFNTLKDARAYIDSITKD